MCVGVVNDVKVRRNKPGNCRVEMRVQAADADGAVLSTTDRNAAIALYTALYAGTHPTPGLLLKLSDDLVVQLKVPQ